MQKATNQEKLAGSHQIQAGSEALIGKMVNELVADSVVSALGHFGGKNVVESLLYILELEHSVNLGTITTGLDGLRSGLNSMFGGAAYVVEERMCAELAKRLGVNQDGKTLESLLPVAQQYAREHFASNSEGRT